MQWLCPRDGAAGLALLCRRDGQDPRHRGEAVRWTRLGAGAPGRVREARRVPRGARVHHDLGGRAPRPARRARRVRPQVQEVAHGRPADRARPLQARHPRRALQEADGGGHHAAQARRRRRGHQRLRRRARGRADLRLPVREGGREEDVQAAVAAVDDQAGDRAGASRTCAAPRSALARAGRALALGGRLDRRHERHPGRHDPPALLLRRRRLARPRADSDARHRRPARGRDPRVQARALLARRRAVRRRRRRACYEGRFHAGAKPRIKTEAEAQAIVAAVARPDRRRSPSSTRRARSSAHRCSTTSPRCSARPTRATASRPGARWPPPSASTRSTRR